MANVQLAIAGDETTQVILSVPGVQGPAGSNLPPSGSTHQLLYKQSNTDYDTAWKLLTNDNVDAAAAIAGTKISPNFGSQTVQTTGIFSHALGTAGAPTATFSGDTNTGIYSPGADQVSVTTGGTERLRVDATGQIEVVSLGTAAAPVFSFTTDPNTGIYSPGADQVAISTAGNQRIEIQADGDVSIDGGTVFIDAGSNRLGVNTSSPAYELEVSSTGEADIQIDSGIGQDAALRFAENGTNAFSIFHDASASALAVYDNTALSQRLTIDSSGNVGIGTSSPAVPLHVDGTVAQTYLQVGPSTGDPLTTKTVIAEVRGDTATNGAGPGIRLWAGVAAAEIYATRESGGAASTFSVDTRVGESLGTALFIDASRRVGIGTTSPGSLFTAGAAYGGTPNAGSVGTFQSATNTYITIGAGAGGDSAFLFADSADDNVGYVQYNHGSDYLAFGANAAERLRIDSSGRLLVGANSTSTTATAVFQGNSGGATSHGIINIGRGATNPGVNLSLGFTQFQDAAGSVGAQIYAQTDVAWSAGSYAGRLVFSTTQDGASSPTERMRISENGRVSIGASTKDYQLEVANSSSKQDATARFADTATTSSVNATVTAPVFTSVAGSAYMVFIHRTDSAARSLFGMLVAGTTTSTWTQLAAGPSSAQFTITTSGLDLQVTNNDASARAYTYVAVRLG
jgi:hypothetical protein